MNYLHSNLPTTEDEWDVLWKQIKAENDLKTDRECYQFLSQMVIGTCSVLSQMNHDDPDYEAFRTFVDFAFEEWTYHDVRLNDHND